MKKTAFLLALLLAAVFILPADAATYEAEGLFRLRYDEAAYTLDDQTYAYESETGASRWFFVLYNDEMTFDMSLLRMENDAGLTLSTAAEDRKQTGRAAGLVSGRGRLSFGNGGGGRWKNALLGAGPAQRVRPLSDGGNRHRRQRHRPAGLLQRFVAGGGRAASGSPAGAAGRL